MQGVKVKVGIDIDALGEQIAEMSAHIDAAMHRLLTAIREFDVAVGWHVQGALTCAHWLAWRVGWDVRTARARVRVARKLADLPLVAEQLRLGAMSYSQARAISRESKKLSGLSTQSACQRRSSIPCVAHTNMCRRMIKLAGRRQVLVRCPARWLVRKLPHRLRRGAR